MNSIVGTITLEHVVATKSVAAIRYVLESSNRIGSSILISDLSETGLYLPGKPLTVLIPQVSGSSPSIYSGTKVGRGPRARVNPLYILPPPILV